MSYPAIVKKFCSSYNVVITLPSPCNGKHGQNILELQPTSLIAILCVDKRMLSDASTKLWHEYTWLLGLSAWDWICVCTVHICPINSACTEGMAEPTVTITALVRQQLCSKQKVCYFTKVYVPIIQVCICTHTQYHCYMYVMWFAQWYKFCVLICTCNDALFVITNTNRNMLHDVYIYMYIYIITCHVNPQILGSAHMSWC